MIVKFKMIQIDMLRCVQIFDILFVCLCFVRDNTQNTTKYTDRTNMYIDGSYGVLICVRNFGCPSQ